MTSGCEQKESVSIFLTMNGIRHGLVDDIQVQTETPVLDVPDIPADTSLHVLQFLGLPAVARHLAPSRDTRLHKVTLIVSAKRYHHSA